MFITPYFALLFIFIDALKRRRRHYDAHRRHPGAHGTAMVPSHLRTQDIWECHAAERRAFRAGRRYHLGARFMDISRR